MTIEYKKFIWPVIIAIILVCIGSLSIVENTLRKCEPFLNLGGPNGKYCTTMITSLLLTPGFFILTSVQFGIELLDNTWWLGLLVICLINILLYFGLIYGGIRIFNYIRKKLKSSRRSTHHQQ